MWSRRTFLKSIAGSTIIAGTAGLASPIWAEDEILSFRRNAAPLKLNFNENSAGMSPEALKASHAAVTFRHNRYPDGAAASLRKAIASREGVDPASVILGNGSTEILYMLVTAAAQQGATIIDTNLTFGEVRSYGKRLGMPVKIVKVRDDFTTDIGAMQAAAETVDGPVLINICNPNNPTGTIIPEADLRDWITSAPDHYTFLVDEAYYDYALAETKGYGSMLPLVKAGRENLLISRTFSKVHGMAGLRVGYAIAAEKTAKYISGFTNMVNVNAVGAAAANASLEDTAFYNASLNANKSVKNTFIASLNELGLEHIPSSTNFVLHRIGGPVADYQRRMQANGILVGRRMTDEDGWNRLSLGTEQEMSEFIKTLKAFRERGWV